MISPPDPRAWQKDFDGPLMFCFTLQVPGAAVSAAGALAHVAVQTYRGDGQTGRQQRRQHASQTRLNAQWRRRTCVLVGSISSPVCPHPLTHTGPQKAGKDDDLFFSCRGHER